MTRPSTAPKRTKRPAPPWLRYVTFENACYALVSFTAAYTVWQLFLR